MIPLPLMGFAFLAGLVTILAPCIWPVLPIVLSSSIAGKKGHQRPLGITLGVMLSFTIFTLSVSYLVKIFHLNPDILRIFSVIIIGFLGLTMVIPALATKFELFVSRLSSMFGQNKAGNGTGFIPGFITGLSLGIVWSPCAGPILATIATLAATGRVNLSVIAVTLSYVIGVGIPLFAFAYGGQQFISKARGLNKYTAKIQQAFGVIMILAAILIYTNYDQVLQVKLLTAFPVLGQAVNGFEQSQAVTQQLDVLKGKQSTTSVDTSSLFNTSMKAPEFIGIDKWLNADKPLTLASLKGKVVLVDFWTYTCINCIRTLPHVTSWYDKYKDQGLVVIGVHTPEFQFEHDTNNVLGAIHMYNIHYPVAQDNEYATWNAYSNEYWPAEYLIDAKGVVRRTHFGEGEYDQTELAIQALLKEAGQHVTESLSTMIDQTPTQDLSPESYLGFQKMLYAVPDGKTQQGVQNLTLPTSIPANHFAFGGQWNIADDYAITGQQATIQYNFIAGKVFLVMKPGQNKSVDVNVLLDGKPIPQSDSGKDVVDGIVHVDADRLYDIVNLEGKVENHTLELDFQSPGLQAFAFTFGQ